MSKRGISHHHTLPPNPSWIDFPRSDGNDSQWQPLNTEHAVDHEGHVNFYRPVELDEAIAIKWRKETGTALAKRMNMPEGPSYVIRTWPQGYRMFDHNKGPEAAPRHDMYLIGSKFVNRFRSVPEFIPHALWLMQDPTMDRANCQCKYCTKTPQRRITMEMGLTQSSKRSTPTDTPGPSRIRGLRDPRERKAIHAAKAYAAVRRVPKPLKQPGPPKQAMLRERNSDLRAAYSRTHMRLQRLFREGELLWCAVYPPIMSMSGESIAFWPGLVEEVKLKSEAIPRSGQGETPSEDVHMESAEGDAHQDETSDANPKPLPWTIRQSTVYKMKLLAVSMSISLPDNQVLPYQSYVPPTELLQAVQAVPIEELDARPERISAFNPLPAPPIDPAGADKSLDNASGLRFVPAAAPFSLAVQIAANVAGYWTPTDDWECKFSVTPKTMTSAPKAVSPASTPAPAPALASQSLHSLIVASLSNNATSHATVAGGSGSMSSGPPAVSANGSRAESSTHMLGKPPAVPHIVTQVRYQGLWWGAERIWTDELVRLKVSRKQIAPSGTEHIYPPAGPSTATIEYNNKIAVEQGLPPPKLEETGAEGRGVFMRVEGLFLVDVPQPNGPSRKECRASGMLYELADEDWEDPLEVKDEEKDIGKGKGKMVESNEFGTVSELFADPPSANGKSAETQAGPSFMPGPSPLKPPPLPNPDPTVSVSSTAPAILAQSFAPIQSPKKQQSPNTQLSHPVLTNHYLLPSAPKGFKFRPIIPPGYEVVVALTVISGRYYPNLLAHPLLGPTVHRALTSLPQEGGLSESNHLWALEGLAPGYYNAVDPVKWKSSRSMMVKDAEKEAAAAFHAFWERRRREKMEVQDPAPPDVSEGGVSMDVDVAV